MLEVLRKFHLRLSALLNEGIDSWESLDVDYEPPRVERLWRQVGEYRIYLHRIHPCEEALYHPHPWPNAVMILSGKYEMVLGGADAVTDLVGRLVLTEGSMYERTNPLGWHYVRPLEGPSLSIMVTGKPWDPPVYDHSDFGKKVELKPLTPEAKADLFQAFRYQVFGVA